MATFHNVTVPHPPYLNFSHCNGGRANFVSPNSSIAQLHLSSHKFSRTIMLWRSSPLSSYAFSNWAEFFFLQPHTTPTGLYRSLSTPIDPYRPLSTPIDPYQPITSMMRRGFIVMISSVPFPSVRFSTPPPGCLDEKPNRYPSIFAFFWSVTFPPCAWMHLPQIETKNRESRY